MQFRRDRQAILRKSGILIDRRLLIGHLPLGWTLGIRVLGLGAQNLTKIDFKRIDSITSKVDRILLWF